ncbi:unnamed protein product [Brachionus calyciflorus]|uniref:FLYWCH-type domain-containing protein n=1 Tax=Brachionus calyciflorus TaxID=104777 RepID=A0A813M4S6_9BILA|nr:unnamed protein product [Brachionus calyciflorus]
MNRKGGDAILIDGYMFNCHSYNIDEQSDHWRCANRPCKVSATTKDGLAKLNGKEHMDEGLTDVDIMLMRKLEELRTQVIYTDTAIPKLYAKCIAELTAEGVDPEYLAVFFPEYLAVLRSNNVVEYNKRLTGKPAPDLSKIVKAKNQVLEENIVRLRNKLINLEEFLNVSRLLINFKSV